MRVLPACVASALVASAITASADVSPLAFWQSQQLATVDKPLDIRPLFNAKAAIKAANERAAARHGVPAEFMHRLTMRESGFRFVRGPATRYGHAYGPHQILCSTAASLGERDCSRLMHDAERSADLSAKYVRQGYDATGSWRGAAAHYHGGPNTRLWGAKTRAYAAAVGKDTFPRMVRAYAPPQGTFGTQIMPAAFTAMSFQVGR